MNEYPTCIRCTYELRDGEAGRLLCFRCEDRAAKQLAEIQGPRGLYAQLARHLQRGSGSGGPAVSGSKTAPAPVNEQVLNLQCAGGPVLGTLETWVRDWESLGHAELNEAGGLQQRVDHACRTLRFNLGWAAANHPAADAFVEELAGVHRTLAGITSGERPPRRLRAQCPCGAAVPFTLAGGGGICDGCQAEYEHREILGLSLADRRSAA